MVSYAASLSERPFFVLLDSRLGGDPSSMASFSIASNPSQKCGVAACFSLAAALFRFSIDAALLLFSSDAALLLPVRFCPCGGEIVSIITKFGSSKRSLAAPLPCPVIVSLEWFSNVRLFVL